jgi:hypothetical protein
MEHINQIKGPKQDSQNLLRLPMPKGLVRFGFTKKCSV